MCTEKFIACIQGLARYKNMYKYTHSKKNKKTTSNDLHNIIQVRKTIQLSSSTYIETIWIVFLTSNTFWSYILTSFHEKNLFSTHTICLTPIVSYVVQ